MSRKVPNIFAGNTVKKRDRLSFKNFVLEVIEDTFIFEFTPTSISLDETQELFTLNLNNIRFVYEDLQVDDAKDYLDVYLFGVKQPKTRYSVSFDETSITIVFSESITRVPTDVVRTDFEVKGKLAEV